VTRSQARVPQASLQRLRPWVLLTLEEPERSAGGLSGRRRVVPAPHEQRGQAPERPGGRQPCEPRGSLPGELERALAFVLTEARHSLLDHVPGDTLGRQGPDDGAPAASAGGHVVLGQLSREGLVVDQAHGLEPDQLVVDGMGIEPGTLEPDLELAARPRADGEQPQGALVSVEGVPGGALPSHVRAGDERAFP
jgi:hypothetical protein